MAIMISVILFKGNQFMQAIVTLFMINCYAGVAHFVRTASFCIGKTENQSSLFSQWELAVHISPKKRLLSSISTYLHVILYTTVDLTIVILSINPAPSVVISFLLIYP